MHFTLPVTLIHVSLFSASLVFIDEYHVVNALNLSAQMSFHGKAPSYDLVRSPLGNLHFPPLVLSIKIGDNMFVKLFGSKMAWIRSP